MASCLGSSWTQRAPPILLTLKLSSSCSDSAYAALPGNSVAQSNKKCSPHQRVHCSPQQSRRYGVLLRKATVFYSGRVSSTAKAGGGILQSSSISGSRRGGSARAAQDTEPGENVESVRLPGDGNPSSDNAAAKDILPGPERLFSNVNVTTMKHEPGSLGGSILLVAGTTVGAGILAIPAVTQEAGFLASSATCIACWSYMVLTGLLVAEVNLNTMCALGSGGVSLVSMASRTLGQSGVRVACVAYLFIHYALLVAYVARFSDIIATASGSPLWLCGCLFTGSLGSLCYFGSTRTINLVNGILVGGILTSFTMLVGVAVGGLELDSLTRINFAAVPQSIPIIALSFVYQNVVPVICADLEGDTTKIRSAIVLGTGLPLAMFLVWDAVILGSIPFDANNPTQAMGDPLLSLRSASGIVGPLVEVFSLLAVATSYLGFVLGLADFLADLLKVPTDGSRKYVPYLLTLVPPLGLAFTSPGIFFDALDFAGTYGVLVLFGILPAAMAWSERYTDFCLPPTSPPMVPGGRATLVGVIGLAGWVVTSEFLSNVFP